MSLHSYHLNYFPSCFLIRIWNKSSKVSGARTSSIFWRSFGDGLLFPHMSWAIYPLLIPNRLPNSFCDRLFFMRYCHSATSFIVSDSGRLILLLFTFMKQIYHKSLTLSIKKLLHYYASKADRSIVLKSTCNYLTFML